MVHEDPEGLRRHLQSLELVAGQTQRLVGIPDPDSPESRIVLVFEWKTSDGVQLYGEQTVEAASP